MSHALEWGRAFRILTFIACGLASAAWAQAADEPSYSRLLEFGYQHHSQALRESRSALDVALRAAEPRAEMVATLDLLIAGNFGGLEDTEYDALTRRGLALAQMLHDEEAEARFAIFAAEDRPRVQAQSLLERAAAIARAHHADRLLADATYKQGLLAFKDGDLAESLRVLQQALEVYQRLGATGQMCLTLEQLATIYSTPVDAGPEDLQRGRQLLERAVSLVTPEGDPLGFSFGGVLLGKLERRLGHLDEAEKILRRSVAVADDFRDRLQGDPEHAAMARTAHGQLLADMGRPAEALAELRESLATLEWLSRIPPLCGRRP